MPPVPQGVAPGEPRAAADERPGVDAGREPGRAVDSGAHGRARLPPPPAVAGGRGRFARECSRPATAHKGSERPPSSAKMRVSAFLGLFHLAAELADEVGVYRGSLPGAIEHSRRVQPALIAAPHIPSRKAQDKLLQIARLIYDLPATAQAYVAESWPVQIAGVPGDPRVIVVLQFVGREFMTGYRQTHNCDRTTQIAPTGGPCRWYGRLVVGNARLRHCRWPFVWIVGCLPRCQIRRNVGRNTAPTDHMCCARLSCGGRDA